MAITQKDLARQLNLSQGAISHVLNGREHFLHPETAERVRKALVDANYLPDRVARGLRSQRSGLIGIILPNLHHPIFLDKIREIQRMATASGFQVMIGNAENDIAAEEKLLQEFQAFRVEGFILAGKFSPPREHLRHVRKACSDGLPVVMVDGPPEMNCPCVNVDTVVGMKQGIEHLFSLGHRRLAFAAFGRHREGTRWRWQGVQAAYKAAGVPDPVDEDFFAPFSGFSDHPFSAGYEAAKAILAIRRRQSARERYTAIVGYNDLVALGAMRALIDNKVSIPDEVSILGYDGLDAGEYSYPRLTTINQPKAEVGVVAFEQLMKLIKAGPKKTGKYGVTWLKPNLVLRESTGLAPKK